MDLDVFYSADPMIQELYELSRKRYEPTACYMWRIAYRCVVVHYSRGDLIPQEPPHEIEDKKPDPSWPQRGAILFDKITMSYRPGLPNVLKGITLDVKGGEKIGVVGR